MCKFCTYHGFTFEVADCDLKRYHWGLTPLVSFLKLYNLSVVFSIFIFTFAKTTIMTFDLIIPDSLWAVRYDGDE